MAISRRIGTVSFSKLGYEDFITKPKKEQIEQIYNSLAPKCYKQAEKLLKDVPNGNISSGDDKTTTEVIAIGVEAGGSKDSGEGRKSDFKKLKD